MLCRNLFSIMAAIIGVAGSVFLLKSIILLSPDKMLNMLCSHSFIIFSHEQANSYAKQKADGIAGFWLILLAFSTQIITLIFFNNEKYLAIKEYWGFVITILIPISIACFFILFNKLSYKENIKNIKILAVRYECKRYKDKLFKSETLEHIEKFASAQLDFTRESNESSSSYFSRLFSFISYKLSDNIDIKMFDMFKLGLQLHLTCCS